MLKLNMLPKKYRLPKREIPVIVRKGKKQSNMYFDTKLWYDNNLEAPLFAFIISKKVNKSAVIRNTIKRKLRAAAWELIKENKIKPAKYVVIVRSFELMELTPSQIKDLLI